MKRKSARTIIFEDDNILLMHRIKKYDNYYTFAGGGINDNESFSECAIRETKEEFGINIKCVKLVYEYESNYTYQQFFLTKYVDGEFGSGTGEEFSSDRYGKYIPEKININEIKNIDLRPTIIKKLLIQNIKENGVNLKEYNERIEEYDTKF